jgi:hypothetical protein
LSNDAAEKEVFKGTLGLLSAASSGKTIINMSIGAPKTSRYLNTICIETFSERFKTGQRSRTRFSVDSSFI